MTKPTQTITTMNVISAGAITSVGMSLAATGAAIRAGIDNFQETRFVDRGAPVIGAPITHTIPDHSPQERLGGHQRQAYWLGQVVEECLANAGFILPSKVSIPLILVLGEQERQGRSSELIDACREAYAPLMETPHQCLFLEAEVGSIGIIAALQAAQKLMQQHEQPYVIIAGVDSWLNVPDIRQLLMQKRLLSKHNNSGLIPGEGASAILLENPAIPKEKLSSLARIEIVGLGQAQEEFTVTSEDPSYGKGQADAMRQAFVQANCQASDINLELNDLGSEPYFFEEAAYARARTLRAPKPENHQRISLARSIGNIGAALGPMLLAHAWYLAAMKKLPGHRILIPLSSSQQTRGAIVATAINN